MSSPLATRRITVFEDGSVSVEVVPPPAAVTPTPAPTPPPVPPVQGVPLAPGFNWTALKADTVYVLGDGTYKGPGAVRLPNGITLRALNPGNVVIRGEKDKPNLWGTDGDKDYILNLTLMDLIFEGGGWGKYNHQAAVRTNDGWKLIRVTVRKSGGVGINIEGSMVWSEDLIAEDNAAAGRGGKVQGYTEFRATTRRNNLIAQDGDGGGGKFTKSRDVTIDGLNSYDNLGPGLWFDGNKGNLTIRDGHFYNNRARRPEKDMSTGRGLYIEYQLAGNVVIEDSHFEGNDGASVDVAESENVTLQNNSFLPNRKGSPFEFVALQLRDIKRDYDDGRKDVPDTLQKLTFEGNSVAAGMWVRRDKASRDITIERNHLSFGTNLWLGPDSSPRIDVPAK